MPNFISKQTPEDSHPAGKLQFGTSVGLLDNIDTNNNNSDNNISILDTQQIMNEWFNNCYILFNNHVNNNITENNNQSIMICDLFDKKEFFDNLENFDFETDSNNSNKESVNDSSKNKDQE